MRLNEIRAPKGSMKSKKRLGRGESSGLGKTSGKGHKGQKARAGGYHKVGFEGGQMPIQRRLPKRGFRSLNPKIYAIVNVKTLDKFNADTEIDAAFLKKEGVIRKIGCGLKILGEGELTKALTVKAVRFTESAKSKIEKAGGKAVLLERGA